MSTWLEADREALDQWLELHLLARRLPADADSQALADAITRRNGRARSRIIQ